MTEPQELAWCPGWGEAPWDWLEECQDCQRRRMADRGGQRVTLPPAGEAVAVASVHW